MKIKGLRWWIIGLVCLATVINYIDRAALGIMWPAMKDELGLTEQDYAWIINIFTITYAAGKFISDIISVHGCSTCSLGFNSKKKNVPSVGL